MPNPETEALLRERIDDLSTQLLLGEPASEDAAGRERFPAALAELARQASEAGYDAAAAIAGDLSASLGQASVGPPVMARIEEGLARLQQAISEAESDSRPEPPAPARPPVANSLAEDPELVSDFILESREHLISIEQLLLALEREPADADAINSVFRGFHTIKGLAGFLEFAPIQEVAHQVETALNLAREGTLEITPAVIDVILESVDYLSRALKGIESGAACVRLPGHDRLLERVRALIGVSPTPPSDVARAPLPAVSKLPSMQVRGGDEGPGAGMRADAAEASVRATPPPPDACEKAGPIAERAGVAAQERAAPQPVMPPEAAAPPPQGALKRPEPAAESSSVRVDTAKLDYLVDMMGEMVIAQSLVRHNQTLSISTDSALQRDLKQLARITGEVQKTAMAMRMVPIGQLFQRTKRQVRDLSRKVGKQVEVVTRGEDTELDKTISEKLSDPLMHMVRNSIDHGIEAPDVRAAAGKAPQARVTLAAYHQAGQIVIEVSDDGRGLDARKILAKAHERALIDDGVRLSETEIFRLILEPGFSTAERVTDISGRGVGMDVVRKQVEKLRGRIEIRSQAGVGTSFLLKLPLTLAIIDGLVVAIGRHRYIVPLFSVREMFRPAAEAMFTVQNRQEMALVRGRLLPVLRLYRRFGLEPRTEDPCQALLIVAETEGQPFCLMVDDLVGKQEVVIKSLGEGLGKVPGVAGGAILGDGRVGLILDMGGLWGAHAHA